MLPAENLKGAIFMSINMLAFVVNDAFMKFLFIDISIYPGDFLKRYHHDTDVGVNSDL